MKKEKKRKGKKRRKSRKRRKRANPLFCSLFFLKKIERKNGVK